MDVHFDLKMPSSEAYLGMSLGALLLFVLVCIWLGRKPPPQSLIVQAGRDANVDQSRKTNVTVNTQIAVSTAVVRLPRNESTLPRERPRRASASNGPGDDVSVILVAAGAALGIAGFFYLRHFEVITYWSRVACFSTASYGLFGFAVDFWLRGRRFDEAKWTFLLTSAAGILASGFLLQAQDLIQQDWVQQATEHQKGWIEFFLAKGHAGVFSQVVVSTTATAACMFVAVQGILAEIRAAILVLSDDGEVLGPVRALYLRCTEWLKPVPLLIFTVACLAGCVFLLDLRPPQAFGT